MSEQDKEFPGGRTLWEWVGENEVPADGETRRDFLKLMGFGLGAAVAASGCRIPQRRALPLVSQPDGVLPGVANWYATTCGGCATGCGLLVKVRDGRPIKLEGNPDSPLSGGGTCAAGQASVLSLYDDRRFRGPLWMGQPISWADLDAAIAPRLAAATSRGGQIVLLTSPGLGPSFRRLLGEWQQRFPGTRHLVHEPLSLAALRRANEQSFGRPVVPHYRLDRARLVVSLDADFLGTWLSPVEFTRQYATARRELSRDRLRHVQIESQMSLTGTNADLRIPVRPSQLGLAALTLLAGVAGQAGVQTPRAPAWPSPGALAGLAAELWTHRGTSLVLCGANDPAVQLVVNQINALLGNVGRTLELDRPSHQSEGDEAAVTALLDEIERGAIGALLLLGVNPVYDHPQGARFARALEQVPLSLTFADRPDETAEHVQAICPDVHFLESWNDAEPIAGTFQLSQPTIAPLFDARPAAESLLRWTGRQDSWYDYLRAGWQSELFPRQSEHPTFDEFWDRSLEKGVFEIAAIPPSSPSESRITPTDLENAARNLAAPAGDGLEIAFYTSVMLREGRWANNPWLQETPDPLTKMTWGNFAAVSPALAARSGLSEGEIVTLSAPAGGAAMELPVVFQPGLADGTVAVALGYGRTHAGKVADGVGANAFPFRPVAAGFTRNSATGFRLARTGRQEALARTQQHFSQEGRAIVRELDLFAIAEGHGEAEPHANLWADYEKPEHFWGMAIDLAACTGCSACVVACQVENNVAVVGKFEVSRGREMHWIRLDRYYSEGEDHAVRAAHQPMMCQHCDHAPCETVCPVLATVHSSDGLNQQVYNRCIGTRYCANNCPYKVRRFNWFQYAENDRFDYTQNGELPRMVLNPDVGIRSRGVMEKCSMCIQRIQEGKLDAKRRHQPLADGAIQTACQQACPADAIVFGDRKDAGSALVRQERDPRYYRVLEDLGTRPGVGYLAQVRSPES